MRCNLEYNVFTFTNFTHSSSFPEVHFEIRTIRSVHITTYPYFQAVHSRFVRNIDLERTSSTKDNKLFVHTNVWPRLVVASAFCSKLVMHIANWSQSVPLSSIRPGLFSIKAQTSRQSLKSISSHRFVEERYSILYVPEMENGLYSGSVHSHQEQQPQLHVCKQFRIRRFLPLLFVNTPSFLICVYHNDLSDLP